MRRRLSTTLSVIRDFYWENLHHTPFRWFSLQELTSHKKQGPSFLSRMGETVKAVAATVRGVRNRPEEFADMQEYVEAFSQKISSLDKVTQRIVREQKGWPHSFLISHVRPHLLLNWLAKVFILAVAAIERLERCINWLLLLS